MAVRSRSAPVFADREANEDGHAVAAKAGALRERLTVAGRRFDDAEPGRPVALINSFGFLEIAVNQGSASDAFGLKAGDRITLEEI